VRTNTYCSCPRPRVGRGAGGGGAGLAVSPHGVGRDPARMAEASKMITGQVTRDEYIKANLADEMRKHRGKKRIRKKKAKRALRMRWGFMQMGRLLASRRVNYSEIARKLITVEPMPDPVFVLTGVSDE